MVASGEQDHGGSQIRMLLEETGRIYAGAARRKQARRVRAGLGSGYCIWYVPFLLRLSPTSILHLVHSRCVSSLPLTLDNCRSVGDLQALVDLTAASRGHPP